MTDTQSRISRFSVLILLLAACHFVQAAPPVKVESANPAEAPQDIVLNVTINGSGFDTGPGAVKAVRFLLPGCTEEDRSLCPTGSVTATVIDVPDRKTIITSVAVDEFAIVDFRDIEVEMSRGRGGKGTTLFSVREKNAGGSEFTTCNEVYFKDHPASPGPCQDLNGGECDLRIGNPGSIKEMLEDCVTTETIMLPAGDALNSDGNVESAADKKTLTAMAPFIGTSVIANAGHRATVRGVTVEIDESVTAVGCEPGDLRSAISFVLDETTDPPYPPGEPEHFDRATIFYVDFSQIVTEGDPLCEAIEFVRTQVYDDLYPTTNDWRFIAHDNMIVPGSYIRTGIRFEGSRQQNQNTPPSIRRNVIGAPACNDSEVAIGIIHGPLIDRPYEPTSEALIDNNTLTMSNGSCPNTVGVLVLGGSGTMTTANVNNNNIAGAFIGVMIDATQDNDSANLKGNTIAGDNVPDNLGICSNIPWGEKGKPNRISGYETDRIVSPTGCPPPP